MKPHPKRCACSIVCAFFVALVAASSQPLSANSIVNGDFSQGLTSWVPFIANPPGPVNTISVVSDGGNPVLQMAVNALDGGGANWHVGTWQTDGPLDALMSSTTYTLSFRARASVERPISLDLYQWEYEPPIPYRYLGLKVDPTIGTAWQTYSINFRTEASMPTTYVKLSLGAGQTLGTVWIDDISLEVTPTTTFAGTDQQVFSFDPAETWLSKAIQNAVIRPDVVRSDTAHVHEGTAALKLAAGLSGLHYAERQVPLDLSAGSWEMTFWVYVENPQNVANVSVAIRSGSTSQVERRWWAETGLAAGWNQVIVPKTQFYAPFWREQLQWSAAWVVGLKLETNDNGPASIWIDDLRVEPAAADRRPPVIASVNLEVLTDTSVTVGWKTDESATGRLDCGASTSYGLAASDAAFSTDHAILLSGLAPNTLYHCQVSSSDGGGRTGRSGDFVFRTDPATPWVPGAPAGNFQVGLFGVPGWDQTGAFNLASLEEPFLTRFTHFYGSTMRWETDAQLLQYLDEMGAHGRRAFVGIDDTSITSGDEAAIKNRVNAIKAHPALAGWYLYDEPELYPVTPQQLEAAYGWIKEVDNHPVTFAAPSFGPGYPFLGAMDYGIIDPYPIPYDTADSILTNLSQAQAAGKPFDMTVQAAQVNMYSNWAGDFPGPSRFPSRGETRVMTYLALNHGAGNILFYGYWEAYLVPGVTWEWMNVSDLANELIRLGPIYASTDAPLISFVSADAPSLDVGVRQYQGKAYVTVVNRSASPVGATMSFTGWAIQTAKEVVTQRPVSSTWTTVSDTWSGYGVNIYEMTLSEIPAAPSGLSATVISPTHVNLSWTDNSSNEDGFKVRRATSAGGPFAELSPAPGANVTTFADTTASEGTQYWYRVTAYRTITPESGAAVAGPAATPPRAPTTLSAAAGGPNLVALTWFDNSSVETGFSVERATASGGPYAVVGAAPPRAGTGPTNYEDGNGVVDGTRYWYRVMAVKTGFPGSSDAGPTSAVTPIKAPTGLSGTALAGRVNRLSWTDNSGSETAFDVQRALKSGSTCGAYATIGTVPAIAGTGSTASYDDVGIGGNPPLATKTYCYQVRSRNAESQSAWVGPIPVKTQK